MPDIDPWASEYSCISADPPWKESGGGKIKRGADRHYSLMKKEEIVEAMQGAPCWRLSESCHLWLWVTNNHLEDGLWVMGELGFRYVTLRTWVKMEEADEGMLEPLMLHVDTDRDPSAWAAMCEVEAALGKLYRPQRHGLGQYLWGDTEQLLFGVRGPAMMPPTEGRPRTSLLEPRTREHSEKPEQAYRDMEQVSRSVGPRLEMFAAGTPRVGWDKWMPMVHR